MYFIVNGYHEIIIPFFLPVFLDSEKVSRFGTKK